MPDRSKINFNDIHLLKKEIEVQGELLSTERNERKAEVDQLRLEIETLKQLLDRLHPGFVQDFQSNYLEQCHKFNPEMDKTASIKDKQSA